MKRSLALAMLAAATSTGSVMADWNPGDPFKMHYPQLPDPTGLDAYFTNVRLADDWRCTESGPVRDIHFWYSIRNDRTAPPQFANAIASVNVRIFSDIPATPNTPSRPGQLLWERDFANTSPEFSSRVYGSGLQGWYDPPFTPNTYEPNNHTNYYQVNLDPIDAPFIQQVNTIYWLSLQVTTISPNISAGWKSSGSTQFNDTAMWESAAGGWLPIYDPRVPTAAIPMDLAFVITPAPGAAGLLGLAGVLVLRRRRAE